MFKNFNLKFYIKNDLPVIVLASLLFLTGVILGAMSASEVDGVEAENIGGYINTFIHNNGKIDFIKFSLKCAFDNLKVIAFCAICSLNIFTMSVCFGFVGLKGFSTGFTTGFLMKHFGLKGILFSLFTILPASFLYIPIWFFMCSLCIRYALLGHREKKRSLLYKRKDRPIFFILMAVVFVVLTVLNIFDGLISGFLVTKFLA